MSYIFNVSSHTYLAWLAGLGLENGYTDWGISLFPSIPPGESRDSTQKLCHDHFLPNLFRIILTPYRLYKHIVTTMMNKINETNKIMENLFCGSYIIMFMWNQYVIYAYFTRGVPFSDTKYLKHKLVLNVI